MSEQEYNIEVLCTCYLLDELNIQRHKLCDGDVHNGSDVIDNVSIDLLDKAIMYYNEEKYKNIRNEIFRNRIKCGII